MPEDAADSGPTTDDQGTEPTTATVTDPDALGDAGKAAIDRMKAERNAEASQRKKLEKEIADLRKASLSDSERAVAAAREEGRTEALTVAGRRLARSEFRAAAASAGVDVTALLDDIDVSRYVGDDGEPDEKAISDAVKRFAAIAQPQRPKGDIGQGTRTTTTPTRMDDLIRGQLRR